MKNNAILLFVQKYEFQIRINHHYACFNSTKLGKAILNTNWKGWVLFFEELVCKIFYNMLIDECND